MAGSREAVLGVVPDPEKRGVRIEFRDEPGYGFTREPAPDR